MIPSEAVPSEWESSKDRNCKKEQNWELSHYQFLCAVKQLLRQIRTPANRSKLLPLPLLSYIFQKGALHYSVFAKKWKREWYLNLNSLWLTCQIALNKKRRILPLHSCIRLPKQESIPFSQFSFIAIKQSTHILRARSAFFYLMLKQAFCKGMSNSTLVRVPVPHP